MARELRLCASTGDRAVILAPQGLDYIVAFFGALQAGLIAVPLSVPWAAPTMNARFGAGRCVARCHPHHVRGRSTTSAAYVTAAPGESAPSIIEVDLLDLDRRTQLPRRRQNDPATAYLQYTSGSTRTPAGVMVSHKNLRPISHR